MRGIDAPYDRLAALPRELWLPGLVCAVGTAAQRLTDLDTWRRALEAGHLPPPPDDGADAAAFEAMRRAIGELGLPALAQGVPALAQQVLRTMLWHLDRSIDRAPGTPRAEALDDAVQGFRDEWTLLRHGLEERLALMRGLSDPAALRWDELCGTLHAREWREAQRLNALLAHLQPLVELIRALGRSEHHPERSDASDDLPAAAPLRVPMRERETRLADAPGELKGIRHSGRLERMLGSEAMQIRHPVLHKLWRARLAESRLLTYESEAVLVERVPDPLGRAAHGAQPRPDRRERGPMILCIDTSGSMRGAPETLAKAVVLEALRTAQREARGCVLVAFGGPGELLERELSRGAEGLHALLELLGQGFDGGTDVQSPIERAIELVHERRWRSADLLIVSDGEFGCTPAMLARLDAAKAGLGLRVQGVLVGDRETLGLLDTCDQVHWLRDWRRFDGDTPRKEAFVPVHSASLTALYFPNALRRRPGQPPA